MSHSDLSCSAGSCLQGLFSSACKHSESYSEVLTEAVGILAGPVSVCNTKCCFGINTGNRE